MSKATHSHITSGRVTPSRRCALVGMAGIALLPKSAAASASTAWAPSGLGQQLLDHLPAHARALFVDATICDAEDAHEFNAERAAEASRSVDETTRKFNAIANAIFDRQVTELAHLTDLAIVLRSCAPDEESLHDGSRHWDAETIAAHYMTQAILKFADVPAASCSLTALCREVEAGLPPVHSI